MPPKKQILQTQQARAALAANLSLSNTTNITANQPSYANNPSPNVPPTDLLPNQVHHKIFIKMTKMTALSTSKIHTSNLMDINTNVSGSVRN